MTATSKTGSEAVSTMTKEEFHNEKMYQATMALARKMLREGLITERNTVRRTRFSQKNTSLL